MKLNWPQTASCSPITSHSSFEKFPSPALTWLCACALPTEKVKVTWHLDWMHSTRPGCCMVVRTPHSVYFAEWRGRVWAYFGRMVESVLDPWEGSFFSRWRWSQRSLKTCRLELREASNGNTCSHLTQAVSSSAGSGSRFSFSMTLWVPDKGAGELIEKGVWRNGWGPPPLITRKPAEARCLQTSPFESERTFCLNPVPCV